MQLALTIELSPAFGNDLIPQPEMTLLGRHIIDTGMQVVSIIPLKVSFKVPHSSMCYLTGQQRLHLVPSPHGFSAKDSEKVVAGIPVIEGCDGKGEDRVLFYKVLGALHS